jgi:hypothetical protein
MWMIEFKEYFTENGRLRESMCEEILNGIPGNCE